mgnify:CR=1 FL=1
MIKSLVLFDIWARKFLAASCMLMMFLMVAFTDYTVVMRYAFGDPPVWGDLLTVLSNIWLVFFALVLTVREKEHIALNVIFSRLPIKLGFAIQQFWTTIIFLLGIVICVYGLEVVAKMGGKYWEMWHFAWEDGSLVFKPNYMPKKYAMIITPIMGTLISISACAAIVEDVVRLKKGEFTVSGGTGSSGDD